MGAANLKQLFIVLAGICMLILLVPTLLVLPFHGDTGMPKTNKHTEQKEEKEPVTLKSLPFRFRSTERLTEK